PIDLATGQVLNTAPLPDEPYTCVVSADGATLYVSLWGGAAVEIFDARSLSVIDLVATGEHPNAMTLSADGQRLFVASGSTSSVWVFDTFSREAIEQISMNLFPQAPPTSKPNSLGLSPHVYSLPVSHAYNNNVFVASFTNP